MLQKPNIQQSRGFVANYYFYMKFYCLWELFPNTPLPNNIDNLESILLSDNTSVY